MATAKELADQLTQAVTEITAAIAPLAGAINDLEAKVTAALAQGTVPQATQNQILQAIADLRTAATAVSAGVADAADGIDEAAANVGEPG